MAARDCWLPLEDHHGEKISPRDITHKMVGNKPQIVCPDRSRGIKEGRSVI